MNNNNNTVKWSIFDIDPYDDSQDALFFICKNT